MRRGIAELNGEGEVSVVSSCCASGKNALAAIRAVQSRLDELKSSLPVGVRSSGL
jgi:Cu(I)/Ag(I) efflux system membrane protein CusA/SilA